MAGMYSGLTTGAGEQSNYSRNRAILGSNGPDAALQAAGPGSPTWDNEQMKWAMWGNKPAAPGASTPSAFARPPAKMGVGRSPLAPTAPTLAGQPGIGSVSTSVTPTDLYTPQQTQGEVNRQVGQSMEQADPFFAQKQTDRPGLSRDAGSMSAAIPGMAAATQAGRTAMNEVPVQDALANSQFRLQGQQAQGQEGLSLANILRQLQQTQTFQQQSNMSPLMALLARG